MTPYKTCVVGVSKILSGNSRIHEKEEKEEKEEEELTFLYSSRDSPTFVSVSVNSVVACKHKN